jgi:beta-phosphoglucomutase-like phosphatase (HAD superfamily)
LQAALHSPSRPSPAVGDGRGSVIIVAEGTLLDTAPLEAALLGALPGQPPDVVDEVVPLPGAAAALGALSASHEVIVAVDGDPWARARLLRHFRRLPLLVVGNARGRSPLANAIELVDDPDTVVVAAAPRQVRLATAAELTSIGVRTGGYPPEAMRRAGAGWVAEDVGEVARMLAVTASHDSSVYRRSDTNDTWTMEVA